MTFRKPLDFTTEQVDEMERLYRRGMSTHRIGRRFGCLSGSVWKRLLKRGVPMRERSAQRRRGHISSQGYPKWGSSYIHRVVAAAWIGRALKPGEVVHHKDGDKTNCHPENLEILPSNHEHMRRHHNRPVWTEERDVELLDLLAQGLNAREIGDRMGFKRAAVLSHMHWLKRRHGTDLKAIAKRLAEEIKR